MKLTMKLAGDTDGIGKAGQVVTLELSPSTEAVHYPTELAGYLAGYKNRRMRADECCPVVLTDFDSDKYRQFSSDDAFELVNTDGAVNGNIPEIDVRSSLETFKVVDRFVGSFIPVRSEQQGAYDLRFAHARRIKRVLDMAREKKVFDLLGTSGNWAAGQRLALGATENWNGGSASDPIANLQYLTEKSVMEVSDFWMNEKVANAMLRHDKVRDYLKGIDGNDTRLRTALEGGDLVSDLQLPGLPPIHIVRSRYKSAASGTLSYFLGDVVFACCCEPGVPTDGESINTAKTFRVKGPSGNGFQAREFFVNERGPNGGTMLVASVADIAVFTANNAGGIITGVYT